MVYNLTGDIWKIVILIRCLSLFNLFIYVYLLLLMIFKQETEYLDAR